MRLTLPCCLAALAAAPGRASAQPARPAEPDSARTLAITHVTVLPMDRDRALADQTVLVRGARIAAVGPAAAIRVPPPAERVDGRGRFLVPGLVDAHVHYLEEHRVPRPLDDAIRREFAALSVAAGVTTVLNLCGSERAPAFRDSVANGLVLGPRFLVSPPCLDDSTMTVAGGGAAAATAKRTGFDFLKVYSRLSAEGFRGIAAAARRLDLPVLGHIPWRVGLQGMLDAGAADVAHLEEFLYNPPFRLEYAGVDSAGGPPSVALDTARVPGVAHAVRAAGAAVTTTLVAYTEILDQAVDLRAVLARPEFRAIPAATRAARGWNAEANERARRLGTPTAVARLRAGFGFQRRLVRAFRDSGVTLLAGTDAGGGIPLVPGWALHDELGALVTAGLTPYQALRAATADPGAFLAARFHLPPSGTVTPGARADLVLLDTDPRRDIRNTRRIRGVVLRGRWRPAVAGARLAGDRRVPYRSGTGPKRASSG